MSMSGTTETRIAPSDLSDEQLQSLFRVVEEGGKPLLIGKDGETIELPKALNDLLVSIVEAMRRKEAVFMMHENEAFTTQAAANFLGISRQYFVRLLEEGRIPFHHVGTHRRVFFKDLVEYQRARSRDRRAKLDAMTEEVVATGLDDVVADLGRSD